MISHFQYQQLAQPIDFAPSHAIIPHGFHLNITMPALEINQPNVKRYLLWVVATRILQDMGAAMRMPVGRLAQQAR